MRVKTKAKLIAFVVTGAQIVYAQPAFAATAGVSNVENFIRSVITVLAGLAGLVATGFIVVGGFGHPFKG